MVKKRLSDLLREEVNKSEVNKSADEAGHPAEQSSAEAAEPSAQLDSEKADSEKDSKKLDFQQSAKNEIDSAEAEVASPPQGEPLRLGVHPSQHKTDAAIDPPAAPSTHRRSGPTKAELESTIADLQSQLQAAQQQNQQQETQIDQLKQQIDRLQAEAKRQQTTIEQLQAEVQQPQSLKAELEEARQVILKLSEINAKPVDAKYASKDGNSSASNGAAQSGLHYVKAGEVKAGEVKAGEVKAGEVKAGKTETLPSSPASGKIESKPALSKSGAPIMPAPANAAEPELESKPVRLAMPGAGRDSGKLAPPQPTRHQQELRRILDHPIRPGALPPMSTPSEEKKSDDKKLSETDMGWVD